MRALPTLTILIPAVRRRSPRYSPRPSNFLALNKSSQSQRAREDSALLQGSARRSYSSAMSDSVSSVACNGDVPRDAPVDAAIAEIIVVRHGETEWNADGRIQGHLDAELNEEGRRQAAAVADRLSGEPRISAVYSSDLKRAFETAQTIAAACGGLEVVQDAGLRERNLGDLQGIRLSDAADIKPEAYRAFLSHRTDEEIPGGGESIDQLYQRCTDSLQNIAQKHKGERVVVVTHGGVIRSFYRRACPSRRFGKVLNTSVNVFHLGDGEDWIIKSWGDISHLKKSGFLETGFGGDRTSG
ncbi:hypothetical protein MLD38_030903 [Melastoma candidum]|uniref:Uncharacterized protein n=1 Tax=Melastoma candidum TaxID=119954 RepID=A0ACB9MNM2_9MYRT|nr:hypothetical protein MLD38_030903 [Melastoma candidum]